MKPLCPARSAILKFDNFVYPMGYLTDLFYGEQFAKHNTNSLDHSLKLSKSFMISPYGEPWLHYAIIHHKTITELLTQY